MESNLPRIAHWCSGPILVLFKLLIFHLLAALCAKNQSLSGSSSHPRKVPDFRQIQVCPTRSSRPRQSSIAAFVTIKHGCHRAISELPPFFYLRR
ncbi:unnamed protein product [Linum trigynum]